MKLNPSAALRFILGGNALFTIRKTDTGGRFTYKVRTPENSDKIFFVSVLTGPENTKDYAYIGYIKNNQFYHGKKSKLSSTTPSVYSFCRIFNNMLVHGKLPEVIEIWHEGRCGKCGKTLTVPESIETGFGPICINS